MSYEDLLQIMLDIGTSSDKRIPIEVKRKAIDLHHQEWVARDNIRGFLLSLLNSERKS